MNRAIEAQGLNDAYQQFIFDEASIAFRSNDPVAVARFRNGLSAARAKYESLMAALGTPAKE